MSVINKADKAARFEQREAGNHSLCNKVERGGRNGAMADPVRDYGLLLCVILCIIPFLNATELESRNWALWLLFSVSSLYSG